MKNILITGISGLIGKKLSDHLQKEAYEVSGLSRYPEKTKNFKVYKWDIEKKYIDTSCFKNIDAIIHLAGENIGEGRWTNSKKNKIISSRVDSTNYLFNSVINNKVDLKLFVSASATGFYESYYKDSPLMTETSNPGTGFTSLVCREWERSASQFSKNNIRTVIIRTGLVQDINSVAVKKTLLSAKAGILPIFGKGDQDFPWIHIEDLCRIYQYAIESLDFAGVINAVAPEHISNRDYILSLKKQLKRKILIVPVPVFMLKLLFGEKSEILSRGTKVSSLLHSKKDFNFKYQNIEEFFNEIIAT